MLSRRWFTPVGGAISFAVMALFVLAVLGWVTYEALHIEHAEREATARAEVLNQERIALWQIDGTLFPTMGVESNRPYTQYFALSYPSSSARKNPGDAITAGVPSPLLSATLPEWMLLHFQLDPVTGWESPQVMTPEQMAKVQEITGNPAGLINATETRKDLLNQLKMRYPANEWYAQLLRMQEIVQPEVPLPTPPTMPGPVTSVQRFDPANVPLRMSPVSPDPGNELLRAEMNQQLQTGNLARPQQQMISPQNNDLALRQNSLMNATQTPALLNPGLANPFNLRDNPDKDTVVASKTNSADAPLELPQGEVASNVGGLGGLGGGVAGGVSGPGEGGMGRRALGKSLPGDAPAGAPRVAGAPDSGPQPPKAPVAMPTAAPAPIVSAAAPPAPAGPAAPVSVPKLEIARADPAARLESRAKKELQSKEAAEEKLREKLPEPLAVQDAKSKGTAESNSAMKREVGTEPESAKKDAYAVGPMPKTETIALGMQAKRDEKQVARDIADKPQQVRPNNYRPTVHLDPIRPHWLTASDGSKTLALVRAAHLDNKVVFQGVILDWPRLREMLIGQVQDTLPQASLSPVLEVDEPTERRMATLPAMLDPTPLPAMPQWEWTSLRLGLALAWGAALIALAGVGIGGWSLISLSERRFRFVSAVTHELRTPLTSLRLYLDLLTSGMITEESKQKEYLQTLSTESDRLNRLIENVLDFARLEKRSLSLHRQPIRVEELMEQVRSTWADRLAAEGKSLVLHSTLPAEMAICTDARIVDQILGNLLDNSRKYSRTATDNRIWLTAKPLDARRIAFEVEDRGPGVAATDRMTIFQPFQRGTEAEMQSGGAGLGLALTRQWTRLLGGTISYRAAEGGVGACFRVELPIG